MRLDKRTNQYELPEEGYDLLLDELNWRIAEIVTNDNRAIDIEALVE